MNKLYVDEAVAKQQNRWAVRVVCRDDGGRFLGASAAVFDGLTTPEVLEAQSCAEHNNQPEVDQTNYAGQYGAM